MDNWSKKKMKLICGFITAAFLVASSHQATPVKQCSNGALPKEVRIDGCNKAPCILVKGGNVTAEWDFVVKEATKTLKPRVKASVFRATFDFPFSQKDACETLKDAECPLEAGEEVTYSLNMPVLKSYRKISLTIEFAFLDDNDNTVMCFKIPAKVIDK